MHWLWGFSDRIKSWLPWVCAYLQRKCGQSWLHSCWFSFTRALHGREGETEISADNTGDPVLFLWRQTLHNPRRKQGRMGDGKHPLLLLCRLAGVPAPWHVAWEPGLGRAEMSSDSSEYLTRSVVWWAVQLLCCSDQQTRVSFNILSTMVQSFVLYQWIQYHGAVRVNFQCGVQILLIWRLPKLVFLPI